MTTFPHLEWDDNGYPTEASVDAVARSDVFLSDKEAGAWLRRELARCAELTCASYDEEDTTDWSGRPITHLSFSTGGWSGAETLIDVIEARLFDLGRAMVQWCRGGRSKARGRWR